MFLYEMLVSYRGDLHCEAATENAKSFILGADSFKMCLPNKTSDILWRLTDSGSGLNMSVSSVRTELQRFNKQTNFSGTKLQA